MASSHSIDQGFQATDGVAAHKQADRQRPHFTHVSETAVTLVAVRSILFGDGRLEPGHQLGLHPSAVFRLDALRLARPTPDHRGGQPGSPMPYVQPGPTTCLPGGSRSAPRC